MAKNNMVCSCHCYYCFLLLLPTIYCSPFNETQKVQVEPWRNHMKQFKDNLLIFVVITGLICLIGTLVVMLKWWLYHRQKFEYIKERQIAVYDGMSKSCCAIRRMSNGLLHTVAHTNESVEILLDQQQNQMPLPL